MRIVIDPGHGGKDSGAVGRKIGVKEKDVVLGISKQLAEKLRSAGHQVFLTRETDVFISLPQRVKKFDEWEADFVLSIHINSAESTNPSYVSAFVADVNNNSIVDKANALIKSCCNALNWPSGGVRKANFYVLRNTKRPVCLLEAGFISNTEQEKSLAKSEIRAVIAEALFKVINKAFLTDSINTEDEKIPIMMNNKTLAEAIIVNGETFAPVRELLENLNFNVSWDSKSQSVVISN